MSDFQSTVESVPKSTSFNRGPYRPLDPSLLEFASADSSNADAKENAKPYEKDGKNLTSILPGVTALRATRSAPGPKLANVSFISNYKPLNTALLDDIDHLGASSANSGLPSVDNSGNDVNGDRKEALQTAQVTGRQALNAKTNVGYHRVPNGISTAMSSTTVPRQDKDTNPFRRAQRDSALFEVDSRGIDATESVFLLARSLATTQRQHFAAAVFARGTRPVPCAEVDPLDYG
jgi:hypothetical protein